MAPHVAKLRQLYGTQASALSGALRARFGERVWFADPEGGMFLWCRFDGVDTDELALCALDEQVAVVPGRPFCLEMDGSHWVRLSYATCSAGELAEAVERLWLAYQRAGGV
jgi:2-aminoadipate transaminase